MLFIFIFVFTSHFLITESWKLILTVSSGCVFEVLLFKISWRNWLLTYSFVKFTGEAHCFWHLFYIFEIWIVKLVIIFLTDLHSIICKLAGTHENPIISMCLAFIRCFDTIWNCWCSSIIWGDYWWNKGCLFISSVSFWRNTRCNWCECRLNCVIACFWCLNNSIIWYHILELYILFHFDFFHQAIKLNVSGKFVFLLSLGDIFLYYCRWILDIKIYKMGISQSS